MGQFSIGHWLVVAVLGWLAWDAWSIRRGKSDKGSPKDSQSSPVDKTPKVLVITRHLVGVGILFLLSRDVVFGITPLTAWLGAFFFTLIAAAVVTGLAALFFTRSQAGRSLGNFVRCAWVLAVLMFAGQYIELYEWRKPKLPAVGQTEQQPSKQVVRRDQYTPMEQTAVESVGERQQPTDWESGIMQPPEK